MPFMPGRDASLLLGAAAAASLGAAAIYALTASDGAKQSSFSDLLFGSGLLKAGVEQPVDVCSAADTSQAHCQVTSAVAAASNGAVGAPAGNGQQAIDVQKPAQNIELLEPAQSPSSAISAEAEAEAAAATKPDSDLQTSNAGQQLKPEPEQSTAEVQQQSHTCEDAREPVHQQQGQSEEQQSGQALSSDQSVLDPPTQPVLQQQLRQQEGEHQQQDATMLEQQLHCAEQPRPQDREEQSGGLQHTQDARELDGEPDPRQQQQVTAAAAPPTPRQLQHLQPPPAAALGPPSERDKAIMYRLSIDKSAWRDSHSNSGRSSMAGDTDDLGRLLAESVNCAAESPVTAVAGSSGGAASVIAAFERSISISRQASNSSPASPRSTTTSPKVNGAGRQRQVLNTTRCQPSLNTTVSTAAVASSLAVQYADNSSLQGLESHQIVQSLSSSCAQICKQHCSKLQEGAGELWETTALDIGCGTGGCCFELALSFSHVLGIDGDALHVVAAKEMKDKGQLEYRPVLQRTPAAAADDSEGTCEAVQQALGDVCVARVAANCDRDNVRFWCYPLPELPPKLQSVDAVLVEDVGGRLASGLRRVCEQVPSLLNPGGVCVVVLPGDCRSCDVGIDGAPADGAADAPQQTIDGPGHCSDMITLSCTCFGMESIRQWLEKHELQFVAMQDLQYPVDVDGNIGLRRAVAGVWLQPK